MTTGQRTERAVVSIRLTREAGTEDLPLPAYMTSQASGLDLLAANPSPVIIDQGARAFIPTGLRLAIPAGYEGQVRPRSGLAGRAGVTVLNAPGTIDADYRGELKVILINLGEAPFTVHRGDRIAQLVICPVTRASLEVVTGLAGTRRGEGGFGHTGGFGNESGPA